MADLGVLLPVRIETRFKNGDLWVRIVPDEPWFLREDTRITEDELLALRRYAEAPGAPAADGVPDAWRSLAGQVGAPRAVDLHRRFITAAADGRLSVRTPNPQETRNEPALSRVSGFPTELVVWIRSVRGAFKSVLRLSVDRTRLLADFADPDVPGDRRWWEDWDEAVAVGLAGIIPASELAAAPVETLFVTGLGDGNPGEHFSALVAEGRVGLLEPGTPTNSVDGAPAAPLASDVATWWRILQSPPGDGDRDVSRALTGDPSLLGNMPGGDRPHRESASALVTAMWPALWGFTASQVFDVARGPAPARWAGRAMFPEGAFPIVRVGPQPYGLLPVTAWNAWTPAHDDPVFEKPLVDALLQLRAGHARSARGRGTAAGQTTEGLLDLISDTPTSSRFRYRHTWPLELWWLGMTGSGIPQGWRAFAESWSERYPLAEQLSLRPLRRYGARGSTRRVGIPLVLPHGLQPGDLADILDKLAAAAIASPAAFAHTAKLESSVLQHRGSSLLIRLAIRSLQLLIADLRRERDNVTTFDPEPFARSNRLPGTIEQLIRQATPIDTATPTGAEQFLLEVAAAVRALGQIPVADLDRMLAATIDASNHRIDPWLVAPVQRRFDDAATAPGTTRRLGAYGWVDRPVPGTPGPTAAGLLHAPSQSGALAAAVLRDRAISDGGDRWHLDITSRSARMAERIAQHVRVGTHLAEALGREVERIVARTDAVEQLRRSFPVRTEHAGKRVCDGLRILALPSFPVSVDAPQETALQELREALDAYGDLLVADAVHHLVEGRSEVAGAVMQAAAGLGRPPELSLLRTPREGRAVSTSVVLALDHVAPAPLPGSDGERALMRPALTLDPSAAAFLEAHAGAAAEWDFDVSLSDGEGTARRRTVTLSDLGLQPAEALALTRARLDALAVERAGEMEGFDVGAPPFTGSIVGGSVATRYERAAALVGLVGRNSAGARAVSEDVSAATAPDDAVDPSLLERYMNVRTACEALARGVRSQVELLGPSGQIGAADEGVIRRLLAAAAGWGMAPDPPRRASDPADPPPTAGQRRSQRLIDSIVLALPMIDGRLAGVPDAAGAGVLRRDELIDAAAVLVSPTGQVALTGTIAVGDVPALTRATGERGLDVEWLTVAAAVRPALARLEAHQLTDTPLSPWTNRPGDPWQTNAADPRRLVAIYAAPPLDLDTVAQASLAVAVVDRFSEVIPSAEMFTGSAFGFDGPASRAPQAILLAVPPVITQLLDHEMLVRILADTRELAHARMARPVDLDPQFWALAPTGLLPVSGVTAMKLEVRE